MDEETVTKMGRIEKDGKDKLERKERVMKRGRKEKGDKEGRLVKRKRRG